jgi:tetratricopeptide (TPR) repeat protein
VATFLSVFPHVSLWLAPPVGPEVGVKNLAADLLLVGSREEQRLDWPRLERAFADPGLGEDLRSTGVFGDAPTFAATWTMGRGEIEGWLEDRKAFPRGRPLNTDDHPHLEFVAPRRNVMGPARAARLAADLYAEMVRAGGDVKPMLSGAPSGGAAKAAFLRTLADRYFAAVEPERYVRTLEAALAAFPDDAQAWEALGNFALDRRDYRRAEEAHRALVRLEPEDTAAWLRLGATLARLARWREAREAIARARELDPRAPVDAELVAFLERKAGGPGR